jgi:penicillin-binding protein 1A
MIRRDQYGTAVNTQVPTKLDIQQPAEPSQAPYFTSWLRPQIIAALSHGVPQSIAEYRAFYGGLKIKTTLDLNMQHAAEQAITSNLPSGPTASLVAIDNKTGEVRAMIGGQDYNTTPFNLATEGHRQPGSSFKPFTLAEALRTGAYSPYSVINSAPQDFIVPNSGGKEHFIVHNFGNTYSGSISLTSATAISDNTVFSQVGIHVGTSRIARLAKQMGIRSPVSNNYAMILGGLKIGVTPLDMAHAYETFAMNGQRVYNPVLGAPFRGPTGIASITCPPKTCKSMVDHPKYQQVLPPTIAKTVHDMLTGVVTSGTGTKAAISGVDVAGKTGTTSNYGDAWFVGWTPQFTCAVWVGYPNKLVSMSTLYNGQPVEGGTYPAIIWHDFMVQALQILAQEQAAQTPQNGNTSTTGTTSTSSASSSGSGAGLGAATTSSTPAAGGGAAGTAGTGAAGGTGSGAGAGTLANGGTGAGTGAATGGGTGTPAGGGTGTPAGGGTGAGTGGGTGAAGGTGGGTGSGSGSGGAGLGAGATGH